jgi:hypothetical protein
MRFSSKSIFAIGVVSTVVAATVISPALGGPSLKSLVKKEVAKQLAKKQGPPGPQGIPGQPGTSATPPAGTLPAGVTLRGALTPTTGTSASGGNVVAGQGVDFGYSLPARPTAHVIGVGGAPTAQCTGTAAAPTALSGHLCIYLTEGNGAVTTGDGVVVVDPLTSANGLFFNMATGMTTQNGDGKVGVFGFGVKFIEGTTNISQAQATWAVTS